MNTITISGRITNLLELKKTNNDKKYVLNTLAVRRDEKNTDFIKFVVWNHQAEYLSKYGNKGDKAVISGSLQVSQYESNGQKREDYRVVANSIELMSANKKESKQEEVVENQVQDFNITEDDLPF